jgi:hypothetical protein
VSLPGASELFRATHSELTEASPATSGAAALSAVESVPEEAAHELEVLDAGPAKGSGRVRHSEKITVYVSTDELLALERARLELRAQHGLAVDRGRLVREAIAAMLADFEAAGEASQLLRRLS